MVTPTMQYKRPYTSAKAAYGTYFGETIEVRSHRTGETPRQRKMIEAEHHVWFRGECVGEVYRGSRGWVFQSRDGKVIEWRYRGYDTRTEAAWRLVDAALNSSIQRNS